MATYLSAWMLNGLIILIEKVFCPCSAFMLLALIYSVHVHSVPRFMLQPDAD
jgi:hypothetical protein